MLKPVRADDFASDRPDRERMPADKDMQENAIKELKTENAFLRRQVCVTQTYSNNPLAAHQRS